MRSPLLRAAFAALCVLTASYWLVVASAGSPSGGCGLRALLALMAVGSALCALVALVRERSALAFATAAANFALCVLASGGPLLYGSGHAVTAIVSSG